MNTTWQDFLTRQGARIENGTVWHFNDEAGELLAARDGTILCDLSASGLLRVSGEEAQAFLQNLLSNDIRAVTETRAQYSSLNSAKGRVLALFLILRDGKDYLLQLPRALCEPIKKKLGIYVLRSKVKISDASDELVCLGLAGQDANALAAECFTRIPQEPMTTVRFDQANLIRLDEKRLQIITTPEYAGKLWKCLSADARPVRSSCWDWLNIRSGIPVIFPQTQEQFVAQMVNLELLGGVSFNKGCYPGQEIVARMQYLGKLKRRLYLAHLAGSGTPQPGDELFSADMEGQSSGMIVTAAPSPDGGYDILASVQISSRQTQTLHWKSLQGDALQFLPQPYPLPDA